jgi:hypothetical protein
MNIDHSGEVYGRLTIIGYSHHGGKGRKRAHYLCKCKCGSEKIILYQSLRAGLTVSCGCYSSEISRRNIRNAHKVNRRKNYSGIRYGRLIAKDFSHSDDNGRIYWKFLCDCGRESISRIDMVKNGHTKSCGCYMKDVSRDRMLCIKGYGIIKDNHSLYDAKIIQLKIAAFIRDINK